MKASDMKSSTSPDASSVASEVARLGRAARHLGVRGTLRLAVLALGRMAYLREAHVWYRLDIPVDLQPVRRTRPMDLVRGGPQALQLLEQLPDVRQRMIRRRLTEGAELWMAHEGGRPVLACWAFRTRTPALAARGGWIDLPPATIGLDVAAMAHEGRDRALSAAAWSALAEALAAERAEALVIKVEETNLPCRRAIETVGFRAVASMQLSRIGGRARVALHLHEGGASRFLSTELAR
jgi:hypothetical protein